MKTKLLILTALFALGSTLTLEAQSLGKIGNALKNEVSKSSKPKKLHSFKSTIVKKIGSEKINIPYTNITSYLEYVDGSNKDDIIDQEKKIQVYVWIPIAINEIGVRMVSPAGKAKVKNPIKSSAYEQNAAVEDTLTSVSIKLKKSNIIDSANITEEGVKNATWIDVRTNPNATVTALRTPYLRQGFTAERAIYSKDRPLEALTRGLYRVDFEVSLFGDEKGTFLGQIGLPVKIPGLVIAKSIEELKKKIDL